MCENRIRLCERVESLEFGRGFLFWKSRVLEEAAARVSWDQY